ncbi:MAG: hypothetical protein IJU71_06730 [Selenomonadaceae bacterium]|nr:hypothetical protein [Selenomonadaceae bacterium]
MRRIVSMLSALMLMVSSAAAAEGPSCAVIQFDDDTRYDQVKTADALSELVMERLTNSDDFNLSVFAPIDANLGSVSIQNQAQGYEKMKKAMVDGNFDEVFEEVGDESKARSMATAQVGQCIDREITSKLGKDNDAEYLIHGTIVNLGVGSWMKEDYSAMSRAINMASTFTGMPSAAGSLNASGLGSLASFNVKKTGIGVQCDVRVIKASTGEIVWLKRFTGVGTQKMLETAIGQFGRDKLNDALRTKALEQAADKIVKTMTSDLKAQKLF